MRESHHGGGRTMDDPDGRPSKIPHLFHHGSVATTASEDVSRHSSASSASPVGYYSDRSNSHNGATSPDSSPYTMSPWNQTSSWSAADPNEANPFAPDDPNSDSLFPPGTGLVGSLVREEGHIYSLAANGGLLYTGSDSKNIRVWKDQHEYCGFKANSGLVKAIIISSDRIFTGHQDGKIRIWKKSPKNPKIHRRVGTLPRLKDFIKSSMKPSNYVSHGHGHKSAVWIRHSDAVSCLAISEDATILYSGSWDRTIKVWRLSDSRCLESVSAHDDAVNSVIVAVDGLVFSGSADGTVKVWKRETSGKGTRHSAVQTLLKQECAVTALAVSVTARMVYCGSSDGVINFWEMDRQLAHGGVLNGHKMAVLCLAAAGNLLFTGSADKTICVWRREGDGGHVCMSVMTGHGGPVKCLAVELDITATGNMWVVYSGSLDKSVKVWKVAESEGGGEGAEPRFDMY